MIPLGGFSSTAKRHQTPEREFSKSECIEDWTGDLLDPARQGEFLLAASKYGIRPHTITVGEDVMLTF